MPSEDEPDASALPVSPGAVVAGRSEVLEAVFPDGDAACGSGSDRDISLCYKELTDRLSVAPRPRRVKARWCRPGSRLQALGRASVTLPQRTSAFPRAQSLESRAYAMAAGSTNRRTDAPPSSDLDAQLAKLSRVDRRRGVAHQINRLRGLGERDDLAN